MFSSYKNFLICRRYEKDIWGQVTSKHKIVNLARTKVWPNVENVPHLAKNKRLLQDFTKKLNFNNFRVLNFSFEIVRRMKKKKPWKMKNRMRFFFLTKILWIFYGNLKKHKFKNLCNLCILKKSDAIFAFLKILEFRLPMFIYRNGFAPSLSLAQLWVNSGLISVNGKPEWNCWKPLNLYDFVTCNKTIWHTISINLVKIFFYGSWAARWRRCISNKIWKLEKIDWAHFISLPNYTYTDLKTFSFYWWKQALPTEIWFYFSVNLSNIIKYVTI